MPKTTKEWDMVQDLMEMIEELHTEKQRDFIESLFNNLEPHTPFLDQVEGDGESQLTWLNTLYDYYCNGNEDAFEESYG